MFDVPMIRVLADKFSQPNVGSGFGCIIPQLREGQPVRVVQKNVIDFEVVKGWLEICRSNHTKRCCLKIKPDIPHFKVIDCKTRHIVAFENQPYATLSYVWGPEQAANSA
jgi:hypothetical protein